MIKKFISSLVLLLISLHVSGIAMEGDKVLSDTPSKPKVEKSQELGDWFVTKYSLNYQGHFKGTYYRVDSCSCSSCSRDSNNKTPLFVKGLRESDPDANITHDGKPSRLVEQANSKYISFVHNKEWQYLKEDMIAVCLNPTSVENMLKFTGMPFINLVAKKEVRDAEEYLSDTLKGYTYNKIKPFPDNWQFSFSEPLIDNKDTTFNLFDLLSHLKELTGSGIYDWKYMSSALVELRQLSEMIDTPVDITSAHQEFFCHLVEFQVSNWGDSSQIKQWKTDLITNACGLYKGIMSRDPGRALTYRTKINSAEIKPLFSSITIDRSWDNIVSSVSFMNHQIDMAEVNFSLFAGDMGKDHMTGMLNLLKDSFKDDLQQKYTLAQTIKQALLD